MMRLAAKLEEEIMVPCCVGGVEAEMAIVGALTTPGTRAPMAILDLGGGSTDAALINQAGAVQSTHLAGAGEMVTLLIDAELGLGDRELAENIKQLPLGKVESLFHIRHEDGSVQFFDQPLDPKLFGRVAVLTHNWPTAAGNPGAAGKNYLGSQTVQAESLCYKCTASFEKSCPKRQHPAYPLSGAGGWFGSGF